jgi:expansin (peptidoglycan-binding protein)
VRFEVFTVVKIQVEVFWIVAPCSVAVGYNISEDLSLKMEAAKSSNHLYPTAKLELNLTLKVFFTTCI